MRRLIRYSVVVEKHAFSGPECYHTIVPGQQTTHSKVHDVTERYLIHRLFITTVTRMVIAIHRNFFQVIIICLLCLWLDAGNFGSVVRMMAENQCNVQVQQDDDINQNVMVKFSLIEKRETLPRGNSVTTLVCTWGLHVPLSVAEPHIIDSSGQTGHSSPSRPLHQQLSIYRL